jgi:hypothetical protein
MKIWVFVCARTPVSPGLSMLDSGIETCPAPGETCAYPFSAARRAAASIAIGKRGQLLADFQQVSLIIRCGTP